MESIFPTLDKDLLKLLKSYNFLKANQNLAQLADDLSSFEKNLSQAEAKKLPLLQQITSELTATSTLLFQNYKSLLSLPKITNNKDNALTNFSSTTNQTQNPSKRKIRIFMDGVFDIIHSGHFNALRQGRKFGDILVVGVNSDADVEKAKGPTLMNVRERAALIAACKWVDEVVIDTPYTPTIELLDSLNIDFCSHGDDPCFNENGEDVYAEMKKQNRFKVFRRTEGISTTEIIGRLLMLSKESSLNQQQKNNANIKSLTDTSAEESKRNDVNTNESNAQEVLTSSNIISKSEDELFTRGPVVSSFLTTGWRLQEFCNNRFPKETDKVIYIDGAFDILHIGHIESLRKARELGNYLFVGVHDDATVNKHRGKNYPILNMQERVLNLLALKYVDDVVIGAPWKVTADIIKSLKIDLVVQGTQHKWDKEQEFGSQSSCNDLSAEDSLNAEDPYAVPKKLGIYQEILSEFDLTNDVLVQRLIERRENYIKKYQNKAKKEEDYYKQKEYVSEV